jgi:hypothetical protein
MCVSKVNSDGLGSCAEFQGKCLYLNLESRSILTYAFNEKLQAACQANQQKIMWNSHLSHSAAGLIVIIGVFIITTRRQ